MPSRVPLNAHTVWPSLTAYLEGLEESGVTGLPPEVILPEPAGPTPSPLRAEAPPGDAGGGAAPRRHESLEAIRKSLGECRRCVLGETRKRIVFGSGSPQARIVFIGEAPGADEDQQGEPFVGEAGQVLTRIITAMGLTRDGVYICNTVKCRPPRNRDPEQEELSACLPYLIRQIQSVNPEVIVALGRIATQVLLKTKEPLSRLRGKFHDFQGVPLMPTYHPSYLLHNRNDAGPFWEVWDDMKQVLQLLQLPVPEKSRKPR